MEPIKDIIQDELNQIIDNPIGQAGNRIKLRSVSHENLIKHLKNIPYKAKKGPKMPSSHLDMPKEAQNWNLTPKQYMTHVGSARRPINAKESMVENIKKHSEINTVKTEEVSLMQQSSNVPSTPATTEETMIRSVQQSDFPSEKIIDNGNNIQNQTNTTIPIIEENKENEFDIRQQILMKKEALTQETQEVDETDKQVQNLEEQYTEIQKQIEESTQRREAVLRKKEELEKAQSETMRNAVKKYDSLLEEVRERKEKNRLLIQELKNKINNGKEEVKSINEDIARIEEETNALSFDNIIQFPTISEEEQLVKKIA